MPDLKEPSAPCMNIFRRCRLARGLETHAAARLDHTVTMLECHDF
jgi:hypothetical protein